MKTLLGLLIVFLSANAVDAQILVHSSVARDLVMIKKNRSFQAQTVEYADRFVRRAVRRARGDK